MMKTTVNMKQFYKELGKLLYSIAFADNKVRKQEILELHEIVSKNFASFEFASDSSGMNLAYYADFEFEECLKKGISAKEAFASFLEFINSHISEIDPVIINQTVKAIHKVADSYKNTNKNESEMINNIEAELAILKNLL